MKNSSDTFSMLLFFALYGISSAAVEVPVDRIVHRGAKAIDIDAKCLSLDIVGTDSDSILIEGAKIEKNILVKSKKEASVLKIWVETDGASLGWGCVGKITLSVPRQTSLKCNTNTGPIVIRKTAGRAIWAATISGNIDIERCTSALAIKSTSGRIQIDSCDGQKSAETVSGSISIENSAGGIYAASVSGMIDCENITGGLDARSVSGMIDVEKQKGHLSLRSVSGALSGEDITALDSCVFETKSGSINIDFANPLNQFTFELKTLSGNLSVGDQWAQKKLFVGKGAIRVRGETLSGAQEYE